MAKKAADTDRRKELEKDIMSYISAKRKKEGGFFRRISRIFTGSGNVRVKLHPEVETYGEEQLKKHKGKPEKPKKTEEEAEAGEPEGEPSESHGQGFWEGLKNFFFGSEEEPKMEDLPPEEVERVIEESKKMEEARSESKDELEDEYNEVAREKGVIGRLIEKVFGRAYEEETPEAEGAAAGEVTLNELKTVAEVSTKVMKMLPPDKIKQLKESEDFKSFKEILHKHSLIK